MCPWEAKCAFYNGGPRHFCVSGKQNVRFTTGALGIFVSLGSKMCVSQRGPWAFLCLWDTKCAFYNGGPRHFCVFGGCPRKAVLLYGISSLGPFWAPGRMWGLTDGKTLFQGGVPGRPFLLYGISSLGQFCAPGRIWGLTDGNTLFQGGVPGRPFCFLGISSLGPFWVPGRIWGLRNGKPLFQGGVPGRPFLLYGISSLGPFGAPGRIWGLTDGKTLFHGVPGRP